MFGRARKIERGHCGTCQPEVWDTYDSLEKTYIHEFSLIFTNNPFSLTSISAHSRRLADDPFFSEVTDEHLCVCDCEVFDGKRG
jgi:hypothetical protein